MVNTLFYPLFAAFILIAGFVSTGTCAAAVIYVDAEAPGANNGSSWTDAYNYLQDALTDANSTAKPVEVRVAQGIYKPDRFSAEPNGTGDPNSCFMLFNGLTLLGGYAGYAQPDQGARDVHLYETVLSGDLDDNDAVVLHAEPLLTEPSRVENTRRIVYAGTGVDRTAIIDGFTITAGNADGSGLPDGSGSYQCGAGLEMRWASAQVRSCTFVRNSAVWYGGAVVCSGGNPRFIGCRFLQNAGFHGGGLALVSSNGAELADCYFRANYAGYTGGALVIDAAFAEVRQCRFMDNAAEWSGGAVSILPGKSSTIDRCIFINNTARATMWYSGGGAIAAENTDVAIVHSVIQGNTSGMPWEGGGGGAVYCAGADMKLDNCTLAGNIGPRADGVFCEASLNWTIPESFPGSVSIRNSILHDGGKELAVDSNSVIIAEYSNIQDPSNEVVYPGQGNINVDPLFADPGRWHQQRPSEPHVWFTGDYHLKSERGRWSTAEANWVQDEVTSTCIDAGDPGKCIGVEPLLNGNRINMGAYGTTAEASKSLSEEECFAPDHPDYAEWVAAGKPICWCYPKQCHGDVDCQVEGGGKVPLRYVGVNDLNLLIAAWKTEEPPEGPGLANITDSNGNPAICADFSHGAEGGGKVPLYRVYVDDLNILVAGWRTYEEPDGPGIAPDCQQ